MKKNSVFTAIVLSFLFLLASCGDNDDKKAEESSSGSDATTQDTGSKLKTDPKGVGKFSNIELTHPLDQKMVDGGKGVYDMKCASCHKLTDEKLVGPGWKGVTDRRTPEWIMNFVTNTDEMIEKDPKAQAMLELCMVRMPNQNLSDEEARNVYEFMRKNDGVK